MGAFTVAGAGAGAASDTHVYKRIGLANRWHERERTHTYITHTPKIFSLHFASYRVILGCYKLNWKFAWWCECVQCSTVNNTSCASASAYGFFFFLFDSFVVIVGLTVFYTLIVSIYSMVIFFFSLSRFCSIHWCAHICPHRTLLCLVFIALSLHDSRFLSSFSLCASVCVCASYSLFLAKPLIFTFHFASNTVSLIPQGISKQMNSNRCEEMYQNTIYFGWFARLLSKQMESGNQNDMQYERDRQWQTDSPRRRERWREICMEWIVWNAHSK